MNTGMYPSTDDELKEHQRERQRAKVRDAITTMLIFKRDMDEKIDDVIAELEKSLER